MATTFFGAHSFGGDATYVERLAAALARRGHEVDVVHSPDAFAASGGRRLRPYAPPPGVRVHALRSRIGRIAPLWSHQAGAPHPTSALPRFLAEHEFDVVHFHNISLIGGPGVLRAPVGGGRALKLMTTHEHWLVCPMHVLWKLGRELCDEPQCVRCTLRGRRPVQLWRYSPARDRALESLDMLVCPTRFVGATHRARGVSVPVTCLPYFLPDGWAQTDAQVDSDRAAGPRPYFAAVGRLIEEKGFQHAIEAIGRLPRLELRIAGTGPFEPELRRRAAGLENVQFLGHLRGGELRRLYRDAVAAVVPSLCREVFPNVFLEAFVFGTPAIARRQGSLEEIVEESGGGLLFSTGEELAEAMARLAGNGDLRERLGAAGRAAVAGAWSESTHLDAYLELVAELRARRSHGVSEPLAAS